MRRRIITAVFVTLGIVFAGGLAAWAFFSASSTASQLVTSSTLTAPASASAFAASSTSITVTVTSGPSSPSPAASGYNVYANGTTSPTLCTISANTGSCTVSGLTPATNYSFDIHSTLSNWKSATSSTVATTTYAAPVVTTGTAGSITTSGAALSGGSVNAESGSVTSIQFCYSTTSLTNCTGGTVSTVAGSNPTASGSGNTAETATLSGLSAGTTYFVNLEGTSGGVTYYGTPTSFTTAAVPTVTNGYGQLDHRQRRHALGWDRQRQQRPQHPRHRVLLLDDLARRNSCTGGTVATVAGSNPTASGSGSTAESATLSGLAANTKYYFNLEATNSAGTVTFGTVGNFTTLLAPVVTTGTAGSITTSGATLSGGSVNAESGSVTSIQFCYSTTSLTNCTGGTVSTVAGSNPTASGSGNTAETATLSGLSAGTTYFVNLEGTSGGVTYYGTPTSFTTAAVPTVTNGYGQLDHRQRRHALGWDRQRQQRPQHPRHRVLLLDDLTDQLHRGHGRTVAGSNPTASGSSSTAESATLSGLAANTKYYFNLEATNSAGTVTFGTVGNFTTLLAPVVTTGTAGSITTSGAASRAGASTPKAAR